MVKLIILLRTGAYLTEWGTAYNDFLMALEELPGLRKKVVSTVYGASGAALPYGMVIEAYFDSRAMLEKALISPEGVETGNLLLAFAGRDAINLFADTLEEWYEEADSEEVD